MSPGATWILLGAIGYGAYCFYRLFTDKNL